MNDLFIKYINKKGKYTNDNIDIREDDPILITLFGLSPKGYNKRKEKYHFFLQTVNNIFLSSLHKKQFINIFCKLQQVYFAFNRIFYMHKYKKSTIIVNADLTLAPICESDPNIICIFQNNHRYLFNVKDLIKIINNSLSNSCYFFIEPIVCKNPYNNMLFNKSTLYNIYFYIRNHTKIYPDILHAFFLSNFELPKFIFKYSYLLREYTLTHYIKNTSQRNLDYDIKDMIEEYNEMNKMKPITIHEAFPKKELINILKPYLMLYLKSKFSLIEHIKTDSDTLLYTKLKRFYCFNPMFGRQIMVPKYVVKNEKIVLEFSQEFNKKHITFYKKNTDFMNTHGTV